MPESAELGPRELIHDVFTSLGFDPGRRSGDQMLLRACPLAELARTHPDFVCRAHQGMATGMLQELGVEGEVRLAPFADPNGCVLHLPPSLDSTAPAQGDK